MNESIKILVEQLGYKENLTKFGASENVAYNYFVKKLLNYLFKCKVSLIITDKIELRLDNRNNSVKT